MPTGWIKNSNNEINNHITLAYITDNAQALCIKGGKAWRDTGSLRETHVVHSHQLILTWTFPPTLQKVVHPGTAEGMISHISVIRDRQISEALSYLLGASHLETLVFS